MHFACSSKFCASRYENLTAHEIMNVYSRAVNVLVSNVILKFGWRLSADLRVTESRHCMIIIICRPRNICLWQLLLYYSHFDSYIPYMLSIIYAIVFTQLILCSCILYEFVFVFSCFFSSSFLSIVSLCFYFIFPIHISVPLVLT